MLRSTESIRTGFSIKTLEDGKKFLIAVSILAERFNYAMG